MVSTQPTDGASSDEVADEVVATPATPGAEGLGTADADEADS
ncbi:hypothetical protein FHT40_003237 [Mycolicibacterium sp. BK556]|nr:MULTISPECIES: hypothetical protein [unclassified Mycolicibacterium]MBB3603576.1 hypothetical protein [Mycolicibacterium sp. BK556]MBB3633771.1 hypothetical protein [Mycolicibacterium sp. BK607]MBB3751353.1 hypothetical protein [Mycolicibacterium sp. BK634]